LLPSLQVLTGEDWNVLMYTVRRSAGTGGWVYMVSLVLVGSFVLLNLFLAVLLGGFNEAPEEQGEFLPPDDSDDEDAVIDACGPSSDEDAGGESEDGGGVPVASTTRSASALQRYGKPKKARELVKGTLFCVWDHRSRGRVMCAAIVHHPFFDRFIMLLIVVSSAALALDNPLGDPGSGLALGMEQLDHVTTAFFIAELCLKVTVMGFVGHKGAYLRDGWCVLDFVIVASAVATLVAGHAAKSLRPLKVLRAFRALRPLRMVSRYPGLRQIVNALLRSLPAVGNVCMLLFLFFLIFAILGTNFFKGTFMACQGDAFDGLSEAQRELVTYPVPHAQLGANRADWGAGGGAYGGGSSKAVCLWLGAEWLPTIEENFDSVFNSFSLLFEMGTTEGWVDMMHAMVDATKVDMQVGWRAS
jgi:hypothetical protein